MITKAAYIERRGASLRALDREIERLTNYADMATSDVAVKYYKAIHGLQATRNKAARMLQELRINSDDKVWAWDDATTGLEDAWKELRNAVFIAIATTYSEVD